MKDSTAEEIQVGSVTVLLVILGPTVYLKIHIEFLFLLSTLYVIFSSVEICKVFLHTGLVKVCGKVTVGYCIVS